MRLHDPVLTIPVIMWYSQTTHSSLGDWLTYVHLSIQCCCCCYTSTTIQSPRIFHTLLLLPPPPFFVLLLLLLLQPHFAVDIMAFRMGFGCSGNELKWLGSVNLLRGGGGSVTFFETVTITYKGYVALLSKSHHIIQGSFCWILDARLEKTIKNVF